MTLVPARNYMAQNMSVAEQYRLVDPDDTSVYTTPQAFNDNAINVCRESTYTFVTKVSTTLVGAVDIVRLYPTLWK